MTDQGRSQAAQSHIPLTMEEIAGYFLLMLEARDKRERDEIRRECFQLIRGGKGDSSGKRMGLASKRGIGE